MGNSDSPDLAAWLTAIWDEEEQVVREALTPAWDGPKKFYDSPGEHRDSWGLWIFHVDPASTLARITADRQILAECCIVLENKEPKRLGERILAWAVLRQLASAHRNRSGWREAWQ